MNDVRCPECNRLLFRLAGEIVGRLEVKCTCKRVVVVAKDARLIVHQPTVTDYDRALNAK